MRAFGLSLAFMVLAPLTAMAALGDQWILGIDHIDNQASFTTTAGAGYLGPKSSGYPQFDGNAYYRIGSDGVARVVWQLSGNAIVNGQPTGNPVPTTTELYKIDFYGTSAPGNNDWQPIEGDFNGSGPGDGEALHDPSIPWVGEYGTPPNLNNHQWIAANQKTVGQFSPTGPGPHTPASSSYNAASSGIYMWLTANSQLYAKWNFQFSIGKSWSALRLTQASPLPGPPVTGDYNGNGTVDAADYIVWRKTQTDDFVGPGYAADGNMDGYIDVDDYHLWRGRFGRIDGSGAGAGLASFQSVPEPATLALFALAAVVCLTATRVRRGLAVSP